MDVTCERCGTEYDFDDALVSERGTTVKCTHCGAQFRVFRPVPAVGPERWVVRTVDGRELVFSALRELQAAIATGVVGREDVLSKGGGRPRRLGSIAELEPFFKQAIATIATSTAPGLGMASRASARQPQQPPQEEAPPKRSGTLPPPPPVLFSSGADRTDPHLQTSAAHGATRASDPHNTAVTGSVSPSSAAAASQIRLHNIAPAADISDEVTIPRADVRAARELAVTGNERTLPVPIGPAPGGHGAPPVVVVAPTARAQAAEPAHDTRVGHASPARAETLPSPTGSAARAPEERPAPREPEPRPAPPAEARQRAAASHPTTPSPAAARISYIPEAEPSISPRFSMMASRRGSSGRWIVGVVLVGATALFAATVGRRYFSAGPAVQSSAPAADDRVAKLLDEGDKLLSDGDIEGAKEQLDKASALAEKDPQVALHLAQLAVVRADQSWLKLRIAPQGSTEAAVAQAELTGMIERMKKAVDAAQALLPSDALVRRVRVHARRIAGDREGARALVAEATAAGRTSEDDLMLAALDLAEEKPSWPTVIERLRSATASEGNLGRARAMLVYALASSGDVPAARIENDRIAAFSRPHPLAVPLAAFLMRAQGSAAPSGSASAKPAPSASAAASAPASASASAKAVASGGAQGPAPGATNTRVADDYVAPNAGSVDISDIGGRAPAPKPSTPATQAPAPTPLPSSPPTASPPSVDTSDLPGFGKK